MTQLQTSVFRFIYSYRRLDKNVVRLIGAAFFLHMINAVFFLILNIYLSKEGYPDHKIADFVSYRFLAVMLLAFPLGFIIKGKRLKPFFYTGTFIVPLASLVIITAIPYQLDMLIYASMVFWGIGFTCMQITILPYILRNARLSEHSEAIALNFASWSISMVIAGTFVSIFNNIDPVLFNEQVLLTFFGAVGFLSAFLIFQMDKFEEVPKSEFKSYQVGHYDWKLIIRALFPTMIISIGAGLTIPFINLFFFHVYGIDSNKFAIMGTITSFLVASVSFMVPSVKRMLGYSTAITLSQTSAVVLLLILATTEMFSHMQFAMWLAIGCFIFRQPLMNMARPMSSELTMYYVGKKNQEIISAMTSTIWSGSWFISSQIFRILRELDWSYSTIFYMTSILYALGVVWYFFLIKDYEKRRKQNLIEY